MDSNLTAFQGVLPFLIPILIVQFVLLAVALYDLVKQPAVRGPKWVWAIVIVFVNIIGPILYFLVARKEE
jgi:hypothetical protein